jgi:hypothetical protein
MRLLSVLTLLLGSALVGAVEQADPRLSADVPKEIREYYRNPDGSCVQCSNGMMGVDQNEPAFSTLLWKTVYGPAERGGSGPERVAAYAQKRGVKINNITGRPVYDHLKWATANGRGAAVTCGTLHMQYLMGHDPKTATWFVCNNNSPQKVDAYDDATFHRLVDASGPWCVTLPAPPHPARGVYRPWWERPAFGEQLDDISYRPAGEARLQLVQFRPRELPRITVPPEVDVKEVRRRGDMEQVVGDGISDNPLMNRFGEVMALQPNDADKWHIWCLLDANGKRSQRLIDAWKSDRDLRAFAIPDSPSESWAHFARYYTEDGSQSWRWEKLAGLATPTVFVQPPVSKKYGDPSTIVFQATYLDNAAELAVAMRQAILNYLATLPYAPRLDPVAAAPCPGPNCDPPWKPAPRPPEVDPDRDRRPFSPLVPPPDRKWYPDPLATVWAACSWVLWGVFTAGVLCVFMSMFVIFVLVGRWVWRRFLVAGSPPPPPSPAPPAQP